MLGAIYIGMSGMDAYERGLQTISNNVANLNTQGYKATEVSFTDLFDHGGNGHGLTSDGNNMGSGVRFGSPYIDFSEGTLSATQKDLDLAIKGGGFLVLLGGAQPIYTRTGAFEVSEDGYISLLGTKQHLAVLDDKGHATALNIHDKRTNAPAATTKISFRDNLSSTATEANVPDIAVYDSRGNKQTWSIKFTRGTTSGVTSSWDVAVTDSSGRSVGTSTLKFTGATVDPTTAQLTISDTPGGADPLSVTLDFSSGVTSFSTGTSSTIQTSSVDGHAPGSLSSVAVDEDGQIKLTYSNGQTSLEGAVAVADVRNPQALERIGNGLYENSGSSAVSLRASKTDGAGAVESRQLELSNVDLSREFGELILVQRGYQASSQIVSVANDMIQQLFGIRGQ